MGEVDYGLPVAFYFQVVFDGLDAVSFKEVSGLSMELETESIQSGGNYEYELKVPKQFKHGNLVLKRALMPLSNKLEEWIMQCVQYNGSLTITKKDIKVHLLNNERKAIMSWSCTRAFPVKWDIDGFDSEKNGLVTETLEFVYAELIRIV